MIQRRLTLCPFIPGRPAVPGNPRAPWREKKKTKAGPLEDSTVDTAPKGSPSAAKAGGNHPAHLRSGRPALTRTTRLSSFALREKEKAIMPMPPELEKYGRLGSSWDC